MDKNYLVTKSNHFIMNSSYDLSLEEQKLILTLASMVQPSDEEFKPYIFRISEFMKLLGVENQSKYTEIPKITKELMKKVFEIQEGNTIIQTAWLSGVRYEKGSGMVILKFNPDLKPYMLQLNTLFTQYKLINILSMKSKYSPRIYEILKCNEFKKQGYIEVEVDDLRKLLRTEDIYPLYADFKRFILIRTQKELNKLTDISFEFEEIKTGRKVTSIRFYIRSKSISKPQKVHEEIAATKEDIESIKEKELIKQVEHIILEGIKPLEARKILSAANWNIEIIKEKYNIAKATNNIKNLVAWIIEAIKQDYSAPKILKNTNNSFTDRKQANIDTKAIEYIIRNQYNTDYEE